MNDFGNTLIRWKNEILHSFKEIEETKTKVNNAIIENRNKVIKTIKRHSNGYSNWDRFRNRVLYVTNPESNYSMYPNNKKPNPNEWNSTLMTLTNIIGVQKTPN